MIADSSPHLRTATGDARFAGSGRGYNGATETELIEAITHLAFYAGWPKAMSAMAVTKQVFRAS